MGGLDWRGAGLDGVRDVARSGVEEVGVFGVGGEFVFEQGRHKIKRARVRVCSMHCTGNRGSGVRTHRAEREQLSKLTYNSCLLVLVARQFLTRHRNVMRIV